MGRFVVEVAMPPRAGVWLPFASLVRRRWEVEVPVPPGVAVSAVRAGIEAEVRAYVRAAVAAWQDPAGPPDPALAVYFTEDAVAVTVAPESADPP